MNLQLPEDAWHGFVSGDVSCFKDVFKQYYKQMYGYGLKLCNRPELVEDCIQELFQTIWERRNELAHICSPNVYLFVSLRRKILKKCKQNSKIESNSTQIKKVTDIRFGIEEIIIRKESKHQQKEALREALNQLSDRQKEVIYLHFYNGMSYGEIEDIMSLNRQSVRNHIYRAMETLRAVLSTEKMELVLPI